MTERTIIISLLTALIMAAWAAGAFCFRLIVDQAPAGSVDWILVLWAIILLLIPLPQLWWASYVTEGQGTQRTYWQASLDNWLVPSMALTGWLWSVLAKRMRPAQ